MAFESKPGKVHRVHVLCGMDYCRNNVAKNCNERYNLPPKQIQPWESLLPLLYPIVSEMLHSYLELLSESASGLSFLSDGLKKTQNANN